MALFCIFGHDLLDGQSSERRSAARIAHFERLRASVEAGHILFAGSTLSEDGVMKTSVIVGDFVDRAAVEAWVQAEPYVANGAWAEVDISPMFIAVSDSKITPAWLQAITAFRSKASPPEGHPQTPGLT
jgi:uncharacterized protein